MTIILRPFYNSFSFFFFMYNSISSLSLNGSSQSLNEFSMQFQSSMKVDSSLNLTTPLQRYVIPIAHLAPNTIENALKSHAKTIATIQHRAQQYAQFTPALKDVCGIILCVIFSCNCFCFMLVEIAMVSNQRCCEH